MPLLTTPFGSVHTPAASGVPPSSGKREMEGPAVQLFTLPLDPASGGTAGGSTTVMSTEVEASLGMGQALSRAVIRMFAGEKAASGVQQRRPTAGLVPVTTNVAPGNKAATLEVREIAPGSASLNGISTQNGTPSHTSTLPVPVMKPDVPLVSPVVVGGVPAQLETTKRKSRITVPMGTPLVS